MLTFSEARKSEWARGRTKMRSESSRVRPWSWNWSSRPCSRTRRAFARLLFCPLGCL